MILLKLKRKGKRNKMDNNKVYEKSEWEHINPKNLGFTLNNHDGLKWELFPYCLIFLFILFN